jgi:hypothetical protein
MTQKKPDSEETQYRKMMGEPAHRRNRKKPPEDLEEVERKVIYHAPHPYSVWSLAKGAMEEAENAILATAFRKLARAYAREEGNTLPDVEEVVDWLEGVRTDIAWLQDHLLHHLDLQRDVETLVPAHMRLRCAYEGCRRWFIPVRRSGEYCSSPCRQAAYRQRRSLRHGG